MCLCLMVTGKCFNESCRNTHGNPTVLGRANIEAITSRRFTSRADFYRRGQPRRRNNKPSGTTIALKKEIATLGPEGLSSTSAEPRFKPESREPSQATSGSKVGQSSTNYSKSWKSPTCNSKSGQSLTNNSKNRKSPTRYSKPGIFHQGTLNPLSHQQL